MGFFEPLHYFLLIWENFVYYLLYISSTSFSFWNKNYIYKIFDIVHLDSLISVFFLIFSLWFSLYNFYWPISKLTHSLLCFIQFVDNSSKRISDMLSSIFSILIWYFIRFFFTLIKFIFVYLYFPLFHYFLEY